MKNLLIASALLFSASALAQTAAPVAPATPAPETPAPVTPAPASAAPVSASPALPKQVHIVVGDFQCGSYSCNGQVLADALTNALMQSGRFAVYERAQLKQGLNEGFIGGADAGTQLQGADVLVLGTVSAFGQNAGGGNACFMGVCMGAKTERITANLRIFDVKTSRIIGTAQVEGLSTGASGSLSIAGLQLGGSHSSGMDKAITVMLNDAVQKLTATIPAPYYR
ncbi:CsgG/HfaB family protein [Deinococcus wulumuqiensis]